VPAPSELSAFAGTDDIERIAEGADRVYTTNPDGYMEWKSLA
jgi:hypothetical protein